MDKRHLIAVLYEKTGVMLSEDDPAFLLVDLNLLVLESRTNEVAKQLESATVKFNAVTTRSVDDFVQVANEALSKFMQRTNEIKNLLDNMAAKPAHTDTVVAPAASAGSAAVVKTGSKTTLLWWVFPIVFVAGVLLGSGMSFVVLK